MPASERLSSDSRLWRQPRRKGCEFPAWKTRVIDDVDLPVQLGHTSRIWGEPMPESLEVDPADLTHSSNQLAMHLAEHVEVHESANERIEAASASGWVGASSVELRAKLADLRAVTSTISNALEHHSTAFREGGLRYIGTDSSSTAALEEQMSSFCDIDPR